MSKEREGYLILICAEREKICGMSEKGGRGIFNFLCVGGGIDIFLE